MQININGHHDDDSEVEDDREDGAVDETPCFDNKFFFTYYWAGGGERNSISIDLLLPSSSPEMTEQTNRQQEKSTGASTFREQLICRRSLRSIVFYMKFPHKAEDRTISLKAGAWSTPAVITFLQSHLWWPRERAAKWSRRWNELVTLPSLLLITTCLTGRWNW